MIWNTISEQQKRLNTYSAYAETFLKDMNIFLIPYPNNRIRSDIFNEKEETYVTIILNLTDSSIRLIHVKMCFWKPELINR